MNSLRLGRGTLAGGDQVECHNDSAEQLLEAVALDMLQRIAQRMAQWMAQRMS